MNAENGWDEFFDKVFNALKVKFKEIYPFKEDGEVSPDIVALRDAIFKLPCPVKVLELRFDEAKFAHVKEGLGILLRYDLSRIGEKQIEDCGVMDVENIDVLKSVLIDKFGFSESIVADFVSDFKTTGIWGHELDYYIHFAHYDIRRYFDKYLSGLRQIFLYDRSSQLIQKFKRENDFNFLYNLKEDKVLPWEVFTNRDPILNALSRTPTVEDLQKDICDIQLIPTVPEEVKKIFKAAKDLYVFGYFRWYFFTISEHYANLAIESAVRHRYNQWLGEKAVLTCKGDDLSHEMIKPSYEGIFDFCKQNRKQGWNYHKLKVNGENFPWRMGDLLDWLLKNGIQTKWQIDRLKSAIDTRNALSHLESVPIMWIGTTELKRVSVLINNLYHQERNRV